MTKTPGSSSSSSSDVAQKHRMAWVTLMTRPSYLPGVQALARSLAAVHSAYPLAVMYTADTISPEDVATMKQEGCIPLAVERFKPQCADCSMYKFEAYADCWTKLRIWQMDALSFTRVCYIDADMLQVRNMDDLFQLSGGFYAAPDCYAGRLDPSEQQLCPLFKCGIQSNTVEYFNAGLFVCSPSSAEFARMQDIVSHSSVFEHFGSNYAEQDFLNWYYRSSVKPLPYIFNAMKIMRDHHPDMWNLGEIHNIHYVDAKPWKRNDPTHQAYRDLNDIWWYVFEHKRIPANIGPSPLNTLEMIMSTQYTAKPSFEKAKAQNANTDLSELQSELDEILSFASEQL